MQGVTTREIVVAAEQRNTSAVSYHFGSREGLLTEVLARRGGPVDQERGRRRAALGPSPALDELVACLVVPYAALLASEPGRSYLRIVGQLRSRFAAWRVASDAATTVHLGAILDELERRVPAPDPVRSERIVALIVLLTGCIAERARSIDEGASPELGHDAFVADLVTVCSAIVAA